MAKKKNRRTSSSSAVTTTPRPIGISMNIVQAVATIDLHGYTKSEAIRRLTEFLDRVTSNNKSRRNESTNTSCCWVEVVTGSGSHSQHGPVLRGAVQALFENRQMTWHYKNSACFLVNASSGIVLYEPEQPRDSKVIISSRPDTDDDRNLLRFADATKRGGETAKTNNNKALKKAFNNKRNEARALERALSISSAEARKEKKEDEQIMKRAVSLSILDSKAEISEDETLKQVMELSHNEFNEDKEAEAMILEAIELSRKECQQHQKEEEDELIRALEQSVLDF